MISTTTINEETSGGTAPRRSPPSRWAGPSWGISRASNSTSSNSTSNNSSSNDTNDSNHTDTATHNSNNSCSLIVY